MVCIKMIVSGANHLENGLFVDSFRERADSEEFPPPLPVFMWVLLTVLLMDITNDVTR